MLHLDTGNTAFTLLCASLVMLMTPGLAFFYGGLVGRKNVLAIMIQSFVSMGWTTVLWWAIGFSLCFSVKNPGRPFQFSDRALQFDYEEAFGQLPDAYETLLRDVMIGDQTLFVSAEFTETAWRLYDPLLTGERVVYPYTAGTWGPREADALVERNGHQWQLGW